jgi:hypothetical protein
MILQTAEYDKKFVFWRAGEAIDHSTADFLILIVGDDGSSAGGSFTMNAAWG